MDMQIMKTKTGEECKQGNAMTCLHDYFHLILWYETEILYTDEKALSLNHSCSSLSMYVHSSEMGTEWEYGLLKLKAIYCRGKYVSKWVYMVNLKNLSTLMYSCGVQLAKDLGRGQFTGFLDFVYRKVIRCSQLSWYYGDIKSFSRPLFS